MEAMIAHGHQLWIATGQVGYPDICRMILEAGHETSPRGMRTKELLNTTIGLEDPIRALPVGVGRDLSPQVAAVEAVQLCGGISDPDLTALLSPYYASLREPYTQDYHGAYGRRISNQLRLAANKLERDVHTRQAVITLWDPGLDNQPRKKDYPCTISLQFYVRDNKLGLSTDMRSNDAWLGLPYDLFQFSQLQCTLAHMLDLPVGWLVHRPVSLHLYEKDWKKVENLHVPHGDPLVANGFRNVTTARSIALGRVDNPQDLTETERWYVEVLYPLFKRLGRYDGEQ